MAIFGGAGGGALLQELRRGSIGTMPWPSTPAAFVAVWDHWQAGDRAAALAAFEQRLAPLQQLSVQGIGGGHLLHKELLRRQGVIAAAHVRRPSDDVEPPFWEELDEVCARLGLGASTSRTPHAGRQGVERGGRRACRSPTAPSRRSGSAWTCAGRKGPPFAAQRPIPLPVARVTARATDRMTPKQGRISFFGQHTDSGGPPSGWTAQRFAGHEGRAQAMRITDVEAIEFRTTTTGRSSRWGYGLRPGKEVETVATLTRVATDTGVDGYMLGGTKATIEGIVKPMLVGRIPSTARSSGTGWTNS